MARFLPYHTIRVKTHPCNELFVRAGGEYDTKGPQYGRLFVSQLSFLRA